MRIKHRWSLALLVAAGQFICLTAGVLWFAHWSEARANERIRDMTLSAIGDVAQTAGNLIESRGISDISPGSEQWKLLQSLVSNCDLPFDGHVIIISAGDGSIICHPHLGSDPELRDRRPGLAHVDGLGVHGRVIDVAAYGKAVARGWTTEPDGEVQLMAMRDLPALGAKLLVTQPATGVGMLAQQLVAPIRATGVGVAAILMMFDILLTMAITNRYENKLAAINGNLERIVAQRSQSLLKTRDVVIFGLAKLAESRDDQTGEHLDRIRFYVDILAKQIAADRDCLSDDEIRVIVAASSLHDIGKVGVPDAVLLKPGTLTADERQTMEKHCEIGGNCLLALKNRLGEDDFLETACEIAFAHHERWDGKGYPFGLSGDAVPLSARIVAVADVYDALTSERVYKRAESHDSAARAIIEASGTQFDPAVVAAFVARQHEFERASASDSCFIPDDVSAEPSTNFVAVGI